MGINTATLIAFCRPEDGNVHSPEDVKYVFIPQTVLNRLLVYVPSAIHNHLIMTIAQLSSMVRNKLLRGARVSQEPREAALPTQEGDTSPIITGSLSDVGIKSASAHVPVGVV